MEKQYANEYGHTSKQKHIKLADDGGHGRPWPQNNLFSHSPIPRDLHCAAYRQSVKRFTHAQKASSLRERLDRQ